MKKSKVVVHYLDGRIKKGHSFDFNPTRPKFHLFPNDDDHSSDGLEIVISTLKAVFFVQDFAGNPNYNEAKEFGPESRASGRKVSLCFKDGEVLVGSTMGYHANRQGFFFFPADPNSNNEKVFVVNSAVKEVRFLQAVPK